MLKLTSTPHFFIFLRSRNSHLGEDLFGEGRGGGGGGGGGKGESNYEYNHSCAVLQRSELL